MRKVEYLRPEIKIVELQLNAIIATSEEEFNINLRNDYDGEKKDAD